MSSFARAPLDDSWLDDLDLENSSNAVIDARFGSYTRQLTDGD
jgi:hypothetical protein